MSLLSEGEEAEAIKHVITCTPHRAPYNAPHLAGSKLVLAGRSCCDTPATMRCHLHFGRNPAAKLLVYIRY
ncbi:MAG: hypothetical protein Q9214_005976, partial [Letrouitia sp. 1 TL-2023]